MDPILKMSSQVLGLIDIDFTDWEAIEFIKGQTGRSGMKQLGRYTLHSLLGKGGSAKVYEAELNGPAGFRKRVALKVVDDAMESDVRTDLVNEARLGALLRHPNVVDIYELGDADGRPTSRWSCRRPDDAAGRAPKWSPQVRLPWNSAGKSPEA